MMSKFRILMIALTSLFIFAGNLYANENCGGCGQPACYCYHIDDGGIVKRVCNYEPEGYITASSTNDCSGDGQPACNEYIIIGESPSSPSHIDDGLILKNSVEEPIIQAESEVNETTYQTASCNGCGGYEDCTWDVESGTWLYH